ncbi:pyridoxamine 5'-phosphate oxidase family protein [Streptomyces sp. NPDC059900]|uniref:pyridoxamine 5'-phosphate oxidase family protein n=1 Tax=Streptomyces sp. NPDC059900 TaxID=3155816 RepID=UPI00341B8D94
MPASQPVGELDARYSSATNPRPGAAAVTAVEWAEARRQLEEAKNLARDPHCALTTGRNHLAEGLDLIVEGMAKRVTDPAVLDEVIAAHEAKYGDHMTSPEGTFFGMGEGMRKGSVVAFAVAPDTAYGFGRDDGVFSHTRWTF